MKKSTALDVKQTIQEIDRIFQLQKKAQYQVANSTAKERCAKLKKLQVALETTFNQEIKEAGYNDFRKHELEVQMSEVFPTLGALKHTSKNLRRWMKDKKVATPMSGFGISGRIKYEPKGVVLIISPWNFPINLTFIPLISAIAAGNTVILKPSENTPHASRLIKKIVSSIFDEKEVAVIEGAVEETTHLLTKPFNHIFFTGAPSIGKIVMKAAANHLTSVSLELGGKSPTIVDATADIEAAAARIAWAKNLNNGQICIAPDYVYVHSSIRDKFVKTYKAKVKEMYGEDPKTSDSYNRIVNDRHFQRLNSYLKDAVEKGGKIELGGTVDAAENYVAPTLISGLEDDALLWKEEIFGPILPIRTFEDISEPIEYINQGEKPLGLYIYSKSKANTQNVINNTRSGAVVVNYSATQYSNPNLPFGGSNNSGIGKGNGIFGFQAFSNAKAVQNAWYDGLKALYPPYTAEKLKLSNFITKWMS